jgi:serine/threonine protein phosphatase Stp1
MNKTSWNSYAGSHVGKIRKINQDAFANLPDKQLWVVADGMGGHKAGELASAAIIDAIKSLPPAKTLGGAFKAIYHTLLRVNQQLLDLASDNGGEDVIGSTVVLLLAHKHHCIYLWSGDSRIYLFRNRQLKQVSRDHNNESQLLADGMSDEEAKAYPFAQTLTHAIGAEKNLFFDAQIQEVKQGDIFLLCSDGLNKEVTDGEIENILNTTTIGEVVPELIKLTLERGARDNVTIVLAQAETHDP